jgi:hypothetical protein
MSHRVRWLTRLIGPAVLLYFLATSDLHRIGSILREVRWTPLVLSLALFPGVVVTKAWRWRRLIGELGMPTPSFGRAVTLFLIGQFAGAATPGQSGDFVRAWYLREQGVSFHVVPGVPVMRRLRMNRVQSPVERLSES